MPLKRIAAHRAATARKEQPVGRGLGEVGPPDAADLGAPGEDEPPLGAKPEIGPRLDGRAQRRVVEVELVERLGGDIDVEAARRVGRLVAVVEEESGGEPREREVARAEIVVEARAFVERGALERHRVEEVVREAGLRHRRGFGVGVVDRALRKHGHDEVGVRRPDAGLGEDAAEAIVELAAVDRDSRCPTSFASSRRCSAWPKRLRQRWKASSPSPSVVE